MAGRILDRAYVLVTFTPAEFEHPGIVSDEGDALKSVSHRKLLGGFLAQTFGGVAWLRAEIARLDPAIMSVMVCYILDDHMHLMIAGFRESCVWIKTPDHKP